MKIWLDLRFLWEDIYSKFILQLIRNLIIKASDVDFTIYTNSYQNLLEEKNTEVKRVNIPNWSLAEQTKFKKILQKDNPWIMIFFNHYKPIFYKKDYILFVWDLRDLYYSDFESNIEKFKFLYLISKNIKNAYKLICLDKITKNELIERFNVKEEKIFIIDGFFPKNNSFNYDEIKDDLLNINIKTKYNIKNDYFVFSAWDSIEKNYEKLIKVFKRLKENNLERDLVFLWDWIWKNINLRNLILENKLQENIFFIPDLDLNEKNLIYKNSIWVIFPSLYEPFPFMLTEPLYFNSPILSSNLKKIENIFWDKINYFSAISINSIYSEIENFLKSKNKKVDYSEIKEKYTIENSTKQLLEIID